MAELTRKGVLIAGAGALALAGAAAIAVTASGGKPGWRSLGDSLTVALPPAEHDRIFAAPSARGRPIVVIDAGHGGHDPGARAVAGDLAEKDFTLALATQLRDALVARGRVRVAMTRDDDRYRTLEDRAAVARRLDAAVFLSIHADSAANPLARGASVYSLSDVASDAEAAHLAQIDNRGSGTVGGGSSLDSILADIAMRGQMTASAELAARLVGKSAGRVELRPNPHRFAAFHVLRRAGVPAVLFEAGYLSNVDDEARLQDPRYRAQLVAALADAVESDVARRAAR